MYQAICSDLDGTLLNDNKILSKNSINTLSLLRKQGIEIIIATGRSYNKSKEILTNLKEDYIIVANNGAFVQRVNAPTTLLENYLSNRELDGIFYYSKKYHIYPYLYINPVKNNYDFLIPNGEQRERYIQSTTSIQRISYYNPNIPVTQSILAVVFVGPKNVLLKINHSIKREFSGLSSHIIHIPETSHYMLEFMGKNTTKWNALQTICKHISIDSDNIIAFGDEMNDVHMLENVGCGFVMKNGNEKLKALIHKTTKFTNNQDGVAKTLQEIFKLEALNYDNGF